MTRRGDDRAGGNNCVRVATIAWHNCGNNCEATPTWQQLRGNSCVATVAWQQLRGNARTTRRRSQHLPCNPQSDPHSDLTLLSEEPFWQSSLRFSLRSSPCFPTNRASNPHFDLDFDSHSHLHFDPCNDDGDDNGEHAGDDDDAITTRIDNRIDNFVARGLTIRLTTGDDNFAARVGLTFGLTILRRGLG